MLMMAGALVPLDLGTPPCSIFARRMANPFCEAEARASDAGKFLGNRAEEEGKKIVSSI